MLRVNFERLTKEMRLCRFRTFRGNFGFIQGAKQKMLSALFWHDKKYLHIKGTTWYDILLLLPARTIIELRWLYYSSCPPNH